MELWPIMTLWIGANSITLVAVCGTTEKELVFGCLATRVPRLLLDNLRERFRGKFPDQGERSCVGLEASEEA